MLGARSVVLAAAVSVLAFALRAAGLGSFMTADEENWMLRSAGFYHIVFGKGDTGGAFMTTHPGATTMWLAGAGIVIQEQRLGFDIDTSNLRHFRLSATIPIAIGTSLLIGVSAWLLMNIFGTAGGILAGVVLATDPYVTGMSQIAHLDALLALFMLNALLSFLLAIQLQTTRSLLLPGIFAGLAMATKLLPALTLFALFGLVLIWENRKKIASAFPSLVRTSLFLFGVAALTFYATWPALWLTDDVMRSFTRDVPLVLTQEHVALEVSEEPIEPASFYVRTLLGRTTPFTLILVVGSVIATIRYSAVRKRTPSAVWLLVCAVGFLVLVTFAAKKADRYALPALAILPVVAGWVLSLAAQVQSEKFKVKNVWRGVFIGVVLALLIAQVLAWSPYAIAYNNPFFDVRPLSQQGWGEGLDAAARLLNDHPLADRLYVASWYPSVFGSYFRGFTMSLSSRDDHRVAYVVTYRNMEGRAEDDIASNVLDEYRAATPAHGISIGGKPYAWIYETQTTRYFDKHIGELVGDVEVGQTVPVSQDNWGSIEIGMATFSDRANTEDVILHIRESPDSSHDIRTTTVSAKDIQNETFHRFTFDPIPGSRGKTFYVALTSPTAVPGNAITVRFVESDVAGGQMYLRRRPLIPGEMMSDFAREADIAYRLPAQQQAGE